MQHDDLPRQARDRCEENCTLARLFCTANVVEIRGSATEPVRNVRLSGFTIAHTAPTFMEKYEVPSGGDWSLHRNAAVFIDGALNIVVSGLLFDQPGGNAIMLSNSVRYSSVVNCSFKFARLGTVRLLGCRGERERSRAISVGSLTRGRG